MAINTYINVLFFIWNVKICYNFDFVLQIFAGLNPLLYFCIKLVFFVRKRLRIKMGQMVTERGNHLFFMPFQLKLQALSLRSTPVYNKEKYHTGVKKSKFD